MQINYSKKILHKRILLISYLNSNKYQKPSLQEIIDVCIKHINLLELNKKTIASVNLSKKQTSELLEALKICKNIAE